MSKQRFQISAMRGYDCGHYAPTFIRVLASCDTLEEARAVQRAFEPCAGGSQAAFDYADIYDFENEHIVVGLDYHFGNGVRGTLIRTAIGECRGDEVLFRGSRADCEAFRANLKPA